MATLNVFDQIETCMVDMQDTLQSIVRMNNKTIQTLVCVALYTTVLSGAVGFILGRLY